MLYSVYNLSGQFAIINEHSFVCMGGLWYITFK